jgi:hypothetical protein
MRPSIWVGISVRSASQKASAAPSGPAAASARAPGWRASWATAPAKTFGRVSVPPITSGHGSSKSASEKGW